MKLTIGENIRALRRKMDMTQEELAEKLCVSLKVVSRWETGATYPSLDVIPAMSNLFDVTADELIGFSKTDDGKAPESVHRELCSIRNAGDHNKLIEQLRIAHRDYPQDPCMHAWLCDETEDLKEKRKLACELLDSCSDPYYRWSVMDTVVSEEEDEELLKEFLDRYSTYDDTSRFYLLCRRYEARGEHSKYELLKQWQLYSNLVGPVLTSLRPDRSTDHDVKKSIKASEMRLGIINLLAETTDKDLVVGDGEPDLWFPERWDAGTRHCCYLSGSGRTEEALKVLEDLTDLAEKFMSLPEGTRLDFRTFSLSSLSGTLKIDYSHVQGQTEKHIRYCYRLLPEEIDPTEESLVCFCPNYDFYQLTADCGWGWFDPIRNTDRFKACLERLKKFEKTVPFDEG